MIDTYRIDIRVAHTFEEKLRGYMFRSKPETSEGILFQDCKQIHTCFMKFDLKIIYLNERFEELDSEILKPWRVGRRVKGTQHILEIPQ